MNEEHVIHVYAVDQTLMLSSSAASSSSCAVVALLVEIADYRNNIVLSSWLLKSSDTQLLDLDFNSWNSYHHLLVQHNPIHKQQGNDADK